MEDESPLYPRTESTQSSNAAIFKDQLKPPSVSDIKATSCCLSCSLPAGVSCSHYLFVEQLRVDSEFGWIRLNEIPLKATLYKADGLIPGKRYKFRIVIEAEKAMEVPGQETQEVEAIEYPGQPSKPDSYDVTNTSCSLEWRPPSFDGGSSIRHYEIYKENCNTSNWERCGQTNGGTCLIQICGLTSLQRYRFKVRAANKVGVGCWSTESDSVYTSGIDLSDKNSLAVIETSQLEDCGMKSVSFSFTRGLRHLLALLESLEPMTLSATYNDVKNILDDVCIHSDKSFANMKKASDKVELLNNEISKRIQELACEQGEKERSMSTKQVELESSQRKFKTMEKDLEDLRKERKLADAAYNTAQANLNLAIEKLENEKIKQNITKGVGVGLLLVPGIGWLTAAAAASVTLVTAFTVLEQNVQSAQRSQNAAYDNREDQGKRCRDKEDEIKNFKSKLSDLEKEQKRLEIEISDLKCKKTSLQNKLAIQAEINLNIRKCSTYVSDAKNRTEVLNDQLQFFYNLSSIIGPLTEVAKHLSSSDADKLGRLSNQSSVVTCVEKLKLVCAIDEKRKNSVLPDHQKDLQMVEWTKGGQKVVNTVEAIDDIYRRVNPDAVEKNKLTMAQHAGWEQFLGPAPLTIVLLGQLMRLGMMKDFSLIEDWHPPKTFGLQYLNLPNSFRASVVQTADSGWRAFSAAQSGMDQIRIYSLTVPGHLRAALSMLESATNEEISALVEKPLQAIKRASDKCLSQSKYVEKTFLDTMNIMSEFQVCLVGTKSQNEERLKQAKIDLTVVQEEENVTEEKKTIYQKQNEKMSAAIDEAESRFEEALASGPSTGKLVLLAVTDAVTSHVRATVNVLSNKIETVKNKFSDEDSGDSADITAGLDENTREVYLEVLPLEDLVDGLTSQFVDKQSLKKISDDNKDAMLVLSSHMSQIRDRLRVLSDCDVKEQALCFCTRGISVCKSLEDERKSPTEKENKDLVASILSLQNDVSTFFEKGQRFTTGHNKEKAPNRKCWKLPDAASGAVKYELDKMQQKIERTKAELKDAQAEYDKVSKKARQVNERLSSLVEQLAKIDMNKMDFEKILDLLRSGLREMANLKEQWGKMVNFFQTMSNIIDCSMNVVLKKFKEFSENVKKQNAHGYGMSHLQRDLLYNQVFRASEIAHFVSHVADTYTEVSKEFLLPGMERLPLLLQFDPETQKNEIEHELQQLKNNCDKAQSEIRSLIKMKKNGFDAAVKMRLSDIKRVEQSSMPKIVNEVQNVDVDDFV